MAARIWFAGNPGNLVFMSTFDNQSMSIGCVGKLGHIFGFLRHYLLIPLGMVQTLTSKSVKKFGTFGIAYRADKISLSQVLFWQTNPSQQQQVF